MLDSLFGSGRCAKGVRIANGAGSGIVQSSARTRIRGGKRRRFSRLAAASASVTVLVAARVPSDPARPDAPDESRDLAALVPNDAFFFAEAPGLSKFLERGFADPVVTRVLASDFGKKLTADKASDPRTKLDALGKVLGFDVLPTLASLTSGGVAIALCPVGDTPHVLLVARGSDADQWDERLEQARALIAMRGGATAASLDSTEIDGAEVWTMGERLTLALRGATFFASDDGELLRRSLALAAAPTAAGVASAESFTKNADTRKRSEQLVWLWADLAAAEELHRRNANAATKLEDLRAIARDPKAQWLLGSVISLAPTASTWSIAFEIEKDRIDVLFNASGVSDGAARKLAQPTTSAPMRPILADRVVPIASLVLYRDAGQIVAKRAELFAPERAAELSQALSRLSVFFGGMDVGTELLPKVSPWLQLAVLEPKYDPARTPAIRLPGAVAVLEIQDPERTGFLLESAFQTAIGVRNADVAQKGSPGMRLQLENIGDVQVTTARHHVPDEGQPLDVEFNLEPACARVGSYFIIGTHRSLVVDAVGVLKSPPNTGCTTPGPCPSCERISMFGPNAASVLRRNFDAMVLQSVLDEGKTREQAERDLRGLASLLELVQSAHLTTSSSADEVDINLRVQF
jgi:hypothetical protein